MSDSLRPIPQTDPGADYRALKQEIDTAVQKVFDSGWYILGQEVAEFEAQFATWLGTRYAISCANGTDALALALRALDIGPNATVVTVSHTAVATVAAIEMIGAVPLLLDIQPDHFTMDPNDLDDLLRSPPRGLPSIRAVIPVHLYGQPADLDSIISTCERHGVPVIEDCSQAHGAFYGSQKVGTFGVAGTFSFYPTKNLGALGDGGIVVTDDADLAGRINSLRQYGWKRRYIADTPGINSRLDELQAAILRVKLQHLDRQNQRRQVIADRYDRALGFSQLCLPARRSGCRHVFHQYVVKTHLRTVIQSRLQAERIATGIHYPVPVHLQPAYVDRIPLGPSKCRVTEQVVEQVLSLPMFPQLMAEDIDRVATAVCAAHETERPP